MDIPIFASKGTLVGINARGWEGQELREFPFNGASISAPSAPWRYIVSNVPLTKMQVELQQLLVKELRPLITIHRGEVIFAA